MNRFGFNKDEITKLIEIITSNENYFKVVGICTHLPRLNYYINDEIIKQLELFDKMKKMLQNIFGLNLLIHPFSSKGINCINEYYPSTNLIRTGGLIYGLLNHEQKRSYNNHFGKENQLKQILTLKTKITEIRKIKENEYIGYGENFYTCKDQIIAISSFGYGYGCSILLLQAPMTGYCNNEYISFFALIGMNALFFNITNMKKKPKCGDYIILTDNTYPQLHAAHLSNQYIGGREYTFTAILNQNINRNII
jgi:alanine racemase